MRIEHAQGIKPIFRVTDRRGPVLIGNVETGRTVGGKPLELEMAMAEENAQRTYDIVHQDDKA